MKIAIDPEMLIAKANSAYGSGFAERVKLLLGIVPSDPVVTLGYERVWDRYLEGFMRDPKTMEVITDREASIEFGRRAMEDGLIEKTAESSPVGFTLRYRMRIVGAGKGEQ